jgi:hypothetical protein
MFRNPDLKQRLPRFRELQASLKDTARQGGFEDISQAIVDYASAAEPAWTTSDGSVVLPRGYAPENGPAVLMVQPHEADRDFYLRGTRRLAETASRVAALSGQSVSVRPEDVDGPVPSDNSMAWVNCRVFDVVPDSGEAEYSVFVPRVMVVGAEPDSQMLGPIIVHEADHWDFYLNRMPQLQRQADDAIDRLHIVALAEKRAYHTTYQIERNLGHLAGLDSIELISDAYAHIAPLEAGIIYDDLRERREAASHKNLNFTEALALVAVTQLFGKPGELITADEITAMDALELL